MVVPILYYLKMKDPFVRYIDVIVKDLKHFFPNEFKTISSQLCWRGEDSVEADENCISQRIDFLMKFGLEEKKVVFKLFREHVMRNSLQFSIPISPIIQDYLEETKCQDFPPKFSILPRSVKQVVMLLLLIQKTKKGNAKAIHVKLIAWETIKCYLSVCHFQYDEFEKVNHQKQFSLFVAENLKSKLSKHINRTIAKYQN